MNKKKAPKISLCMIVKNEEAVLSRCLKSVRDGVDEIVVVDTGSTDRTESIAKRYGARVYRHRWQNSFSEARNYALQYVTGDWVLQLDADEELEKKDIPHLRRVVRANGYSAVFLSIYNYLPQGRTQLYFPRLFRLGKAHYEGIVHNQLVYEGRPLLSGIRIHHYGYDLTAEEMAAKYDRSTRLLRRQLEEDPEDVFAWYNLIRMYRNRGRFELAAETGKDVLDDLSFDGKDSLYLMVCYDTAASYLELGNYRISEKFCQRALKRDPEYLDVLFTLGLVHVKTRHYQKAVKSLRRFLDALDRHRRTPKLHLLCLGTVDYDYLAHALIGDCFYEMGNVEGARKSYRRALELYSRNGDSTLPRSPRHKDIFLQLGNASVRVSDFKKAIGFYEAYLSNNGTTPQVLNNLAGCYAECGEVSKAIHLYRSAIDINPYYKEAQKNLHVLLRRAVKKPSRIAEAVPV